LQLAAGRRTQPPSSDARAVSPPAPVLDRPSPSTGRSLRDMAQRRPSTRRQTPTRPLTEREHRFVRAYVGEAAGNGTEAARLAGYQGSNKALGVTAVRLLG